MLMENAGAKSTDTSERWNAILVRYGKEGFLDQKTPTDKVIQKSEQGPGDELIYDPL